MDALCGCLMCQIARVWEVGKKRKILESYFSFPEVEVIN